MNIDYGYELPNSDVKGQNQTTTRGNEGYSRKYKRCLDNSGGVTSEMRNCNGNELKFQDNLLKYYKQAMKVLDAAHRDELKKVQRLWMKYRDAKCGFLFGLTGGTMDLTVFTIKRRTV
jgi:uncharacterized protein YecT (DUF1311 family)